MKEMLLPNDTKSQLASLYDEMRPQSLFPLWEVLSALVPATPRPASVAALWQFGEVRQYLMRAGDLISAQQAERRVIILENPGTPGSSAITGPLYAGLQLIMPGEFAPCHRHVQSALRFVMEGEGAYTAVDGERAIMRPFDLVLTPNWQWHDHGNPSQRPMIWLDGLDIPMIRHFDAGFSEKAPFDSRPESAPADDSMRRYGRNMRPLRGTTGDRRPPSQPLFHYSFAQWRESLDDISQASTPDPHYGHALEFINPATGGHAMNTIAADVRLIPAGFETRPRRASAGTVYVVVEGTGDALIDKTEYRLSEGDIFTAPSWSEQTFTAHKNLVLFGYSDKAAQERLGLFREWKQ